MVTSLSRVDTGRRSLLHWVFAPAPGEASTYFRTYIVPYLATVALFLVAPLAVDFLADPKAMLRIEGLRLPFLRDWHFFFLFAVTTPLLVTLLTTERLVIPAQLGMLEASGVLSPSASSAKEPAVVWTARYSRLNTVAQILGLAVALIASWANYAIFTGPAYTGWQAHNGVLNLPGVVFTFWQLPAFYFVAVCYLLRGLYTAYFLRELAKTRHVKVKSFHPDRSGGLRAVSKIGLRAQYILSAGGVNLVLLLHGVVLLQPDAAHLTFTLLAASLYLIGGPAILLFPLLPFHSAMQSHKKAQARIVDGRLRNEYEAIMQELANKGVSDEAEASLKRLLTVRSLVDSIPTWPFDTNVLTGFLGTYSAPLLAYVLIPFLKQFEPIHQALFR